MERHYFQILSVNLSDQRIEGLNIFISYSIDIERQNDSKGSKENAIRL